MFCCPHCSQLSTIFFSIVTPDSGSTTLSTIVNNLEQCGQQNIVQSCSHQPSTCCSFLLCISVAQWSQHCKGVGLTPAKRPVDTHLFYFILQVCH